MANRDLPDANIIRNEKELSGAEEFVLVNYRKEHNDALPTPENSEDAELTRELREKFGDPTIRSILFDRIVHHFHSWWGADAQMYRATRFDDYVNGTDLIIKFYNKEGKPVATLSIDTTVPDDNLDTVRTKFKKIIDKLENKEMGTIKYMPKDSVKNPFGEKNHVPQVIVALNLGTLERLCKDIEQSVGKGNDEQIMRIHSYQLTMLDSVVEQLTIQREILIKYEQEGHLNSAQRMEMDEKLVQMIDIVKSIISEKENPPGGGPGVKRDDSWSDYVSQYFKNHADFLRLAA